MAIKGTKEEIIDVLLESKAHDIIMFTRLLISEVGKSKAKDLIRKSRWERNFLQGREAAKKMNWPQELDSFIKRYFVEEMKKYVWLPLPQIEQIERNRVICTFSSQCPGRTLANVASGDQELMQFLKEAYCVHDQAWAKGFNPNIDFEVTKIYYDGDDCCQFDMRI